MIFYCLSIDRFDYATPLVLDPTKRFDPLNFYAVFRESLYGSLYGRKKIAWMGIGSFPFSAGSYVPDLCCVMVTRFS